MRLFLLFLLFISYHAYPQVNSVEVSRKLRVSNEEEARLQLLHAAVMKQIEARAGELGFKFEDFKGKLHKRFEAYFANLKERKLAEKFGVQYKTTLTDAQKDEALKTLEDNSFKYFIRYARLQDILKAHKFSVIAQDPKEKNLWQARIDLEVDKKKLESLLKKIVNNETKPYSKIYLISVIDLQQFDWKDLNLDTEQAFKKPVIESWLKWLNENTPTTVDGIQECDAECMSFYSKWSETQAENLVIPDEFQHSVFLNINHTLKRKILKSSLSEVNFEWEGRALIQDVPTKRLLSSSTLPLEYRRFQNVEQNLLNSSLASSIYKSAIPALMDFKKKLEEKSGLNKSLSRSSKLVIQGYKNISDVMALNEILKSRGSSLGLEISLDSFSKDKAHLNCYYHGEEKSFTDLLSAIKELKSSHRYVLVNEFTGVHHVIKLVTE